MFFQADTSEFPEFYDNGELYQLDGTSTDEEELISRGRELVERKKMPVEDFKIRQDGNHYGLYVR